MKKIIITFSVLLFLAVAATAEEKGPIKPSAEEKCPVCGMFVAKYPDWVGEIIFNDGKSMPFQSGWVDTGNTYQVFDFSQIFCNSGS